MRGIAREWTMRVSLVTLAAALALGGCAERSMSGDKMSGDKMSGDKTMDKKDGAMTSKDDKMMDKK